MGIKNAFVRNFFAEFLGTFLLVLFGNAAVVSTVGSGGTLNFTHISFGYGFALMIGILVSGGVSGGHLNPAVSLTMVLLRKLDVKQFPVYVVAQFLGAFFAALVLWGNFADAILIMEGIDPNQDQLEITYTSATVGLFGTFPANQNISTATLAMDQILGTALLLIIILAVTDDRNMKVSSGLVPLLIGLGLAAIHFSFGLNAGCAVNPARDFSPRVLSWIAGWEMAFGYGDYWWWIPLLMPFIGGPIGGFIYTGLISMHHPKDEF